MSSDLLSVPLAYRFGERRWLAGQGSPPVVSCRVFPCLFVPSRVASFALLTTTIKYSTVYSTVQCIYEYTSTLSMSLCSEASQVHDTEHIQHIPYFPSCVWRKTSFLYIWSFLSEKRENSRADPHSNALLLYCDVDCEVQNIVTTVFYTQCRWRSCE